MLERSQEDFYQYDIATTLELGKFTGAKSRLSIPFYYSYSKEVASPEYYPLDPDITLDDVIDAAESQHEKDSIKDLSQAVVQRKSINFTNVRLKPKNDKSKIYDISNLSATYSYNIETSHDVSTEKKIRKDYRGVLAYNFNNRPKMYTPFKNVKLFKNNAFKLVRDFNFYLMPTQLSYRMEMIRNYSQEQLRNVNNPNFVNIAPSTDVVAVFTFEIIIKEDNFSFTICFPSRVMEKERNFLTLILMGEVLRDRELIMLIGNPESWWGLFP